jgi:hypothetical protein
MNKDQAKEIIKSGWHDLLDKAYSVTDQLHFANIVDISTRHSMLQIIFEEPLDNTQKYVLDCISYKIERESAKICEECGNFGVRRKDIAESPCLCTTCYTIQYNEMMESASPQVTNQEPQ